MIPIIASILSVFILIGGGIPHYSNKTFEDSLKSNLNESATVSIKTYKSPSYAMFGGNFDRLEINVKKPQIMNIEFDSVKLIAENVKIDYQKLNSDKINFDFLQQGKSDVEVIMSNESLYKFINIPSLTTKLNNLLSNFKIPIPMLSGEVSIDNVNIAFEDNRPKVTGNLISLGGFITIPFSFSFELLVTAKNTIELYKPQVVVMGEPLIMDEIQDLVKYVNPIVDINQLNKTGKNIQLKNLYFKNNKLRILGTFSAT